VGDAKGVAGYVPHNFVEQYTAGRKVIAIASFDPDADGAAAPDDLPLTAGDILVQLVQVTADDDDGFLDVVHTAGPYMGYRGFVPADCVDDYEVEDDEMDGVAVAAGDADSSLALPTGEEGAPAEWQSLFCTVLYDYDPTVEDAEDDEQLVLHEGERLELIGPMDEDGFYEAVREEGPNKGEAGLVPSTFIELLAEGDEAAEDTDFGGTILEKGMGAPLDAVVEGFEGPPPTYEDFVGSDAGDEDWVVYRAIYDYDPSTHNSEPDDDELAFLKDDPIQVFGEPDEDGFLVAAHLGGPDVGIKGYIPGNFVEQASDADQTLYKSSIAK
jgi:hypothetical protein